MYFVGRLSLGLCGLFGGEKFCPCKDMVLQNFVHSFKTLGHVVL